MNELCRLSATAAVALLKRRKVSPLDLIDAAAALASGQVWLATGGARRLQ